MSRTRSLALTSAGLVLVPLLGACGGVPQGLERACTLVDEMQRMGTGEAAYAERRRQTLSLVEQYLAEEPDGEHVDLATTIQGALPGATVDEQDDPEAAARACADVV